MNTRARVKNQDGQEKTTGNTLWQTTFSVLASFFGVQSFRNRQRDFSRGKASHFIVIGLLMTAGLVITLVLLVNLLIHALAK